MAGNLRVLLVGGPMYDPPYERLSAFEEREGLRVEVVVAPTHPEPSEIIEEEFSSRAARYDWISTLAKYAPSQRRYLTPLDDDLGGDELSPIAPRPLELARIDGPLLDVAAERGVALLNAAPYGSGFLAKGPNAYARYEYREAPEEMVERARAIQAACGKFGAPLAAAALRFSLGDERIASTVVGISRPERVRQTLELASHEIPEELWEELEALAAPSNGGSGKSKNAETGG